MKVAVSEMTDTQSSIDRGVTEVTKAGSAFSAIRQAVSSVATEAGVGAVAANRIDESVREIRAKAEGLDSMAESNAAVAEEVAATSEESAATSHTVGASAETPTGVAQKLRDSVSQFEF